MRALLQFAMIGLLICNGMARATSFFPYAERCVTDSNGRYYVVVKRKDKAGEKSDYGPVTITIAERAKGSAAVQPAMATDRDGDSYRATVDPKIRVRDGDTVHGQIVLDVPPGIILVSSKGLGIVTLDVYGFNEGQDAIKNAVRVYSLKGELQHRTARTEIFDSKAETQFPRIDGSTWWVGAAWIDEKRDHVVIVGKTRSEKPDTCPVTTLDIGAGKHQSGGMDLIDRAIIERNSAAMVPALELAMQFKLSGSKPALPAIIDDKDLPLMARLHAAVLLATLGDKHGIKLLKDTALKATTAEAGNAKYSLRYEVYYAIDQSSLALGNDSLSILKDTLKKNGRTYSSAHVNAFQRLGKQGVPTLLAILQEKGDFDSHYEAITCLGYLGADAVEAVPELRKLLQDDREKKTGLSFPSRMKTNAAWALKLIGPPAKAAIPDLVEMSRSKNEDDRTSAKEALAAIRNEK